MHNDTSMRAFSIYDTFFAPTSLPSGVRYHFSSLDYSGGFVVRWCALSYNYLISLCVTLLNVRLVRVNMRVFLLALYGTKPRLELDGGIPLLESVLVCNVAVGSMFYFCQGFGQVFSYPITSYPRMSVLYVYVDVDVRIMPVSISLAVLFLSCQLRGLWPATEWIDLLSP
ncbi:hypothetical protein BDW66DRAFT_96624 [Aspergillus desertorum]